MLTGYTFILAAAICWGLSATWARHLITSGHADALLLSQTRVFFAWFLLACGLGISGRKHFTVAPRDLIVFAVLGIVGMAGANYFLYRAIGQMNAALADLIQFTAPVLVVLWMWIRRQEPLDKPKLIALVLSLTGCAWALGVTGTNVAAPGGAVLSALISAVCFASVLVLGKRISASHSVFSYLHYALLSASLFWFFITPPWTLIPRIGTVDTFFLLVLFGTTSILLPYLFFFAGLQRVPASRAGIVSTFEPVVVAFGSWLFLAEPLSLIQFLGMLLVVVAIVLVEVTSPRSERLEAPDQAL